MASSARKRKRRRANYKAPQDSRSQEHQPEETPRPPAETRRRPGRDRPPAPWDPFPLVEVVVLLALVLLIAGFFVQGSRGPTMIVAGVTLGMLGGLELSIREHFAGYKSHTTVLAGTLAVATLAIAFFAAGERPSVVGLAAAVVVFVAAFYLLREAFKRRSGGFGFR